MKLSNGRKYSVQKLGREKWKYVPLDPDCKCGRKGEREGVWKSLRTIPLSYSNKEKLKTLNRWPYDIERDKVSFCSFVRYHTTFEIPRILHTHALTHILENHKEATTTNPFICVHTSSEQQQSNSIPHLHRSIIVSPFLRGICMCDGRRSFRPPSVSMYWRRSFAQHTNTDTQFTWKARDSCYACLNVYDNGLTSSFRVWHLCRNGWKLLHETYRTDPVVVVGSVLV